MGVFALILINIYFYSALQIDFMANIMPKCGICGKDVPEQPKITAEGKCSVCGTKLKPAE